MSPVMASTGEVVAELYEQSGGRPIDGVVVADVYVIAQLLRFTGPVEPADGDRPLNAGNAETYLLNTQYRIPEKDDRIDLIEQASELVVRKIFSGTSVPADELLASMGPLVEQGRLAAYATRDDEQRFLERIGLPERSTRPTTTTPSRSRSTTSPGTRSTSISRRRPRTGPRSRWRPEHWTPNSPSRCATTRRSSRQPRYVIGNALGAPLGTNRTYVSVFTRLPTEGLRVDGVAVDSEFGVEAGYFVTSAFVTVPSGEQRTVTTSVSGSVDTSDGYSLFVRSPPAVGDTPFDVEVDVVDDARSETTQLDRAGVLHVDVPR